MVGLSSNSIANLMRDAREGEPVPELDERAGPTIDHEDPHLLMFKLKRRHQRAMLRRMLQEAGYGELARVASLTRDEPDHFQE